jgi:LysR family transcriptional regulator, chromosome initiation inhibitor
MWDYAALSALEAVVREGSFDRAARALHVTPSAVSQRIRGLEERVGCALVVRGQPCQATDMGRQLCQHVERVRLLEQDLAGQTPQLRSEGDARVNLSVAVNADSLATWFAPAVARFGAEYPVWLNLAVDDQDHTAEWLRTGAVLAAVTASAAAPAGCSVRPLGAMRYRAVASPAIMARYFANGVTAEALAQAPSLVFNTKDELQDRWVQRLLGRRLALPGHTLPSAQAFVTAGLAGMGWALHPEALIAQHLSDGHLQELRPDSPLDIPLYWQQARATSAVLAGLTEVVVREAAQSLHSGVTRV